MPGNSPICFFYRYIGLYREIEKLTSSSERIRGFIGSGVVCAPAVGAMLLGNHWQREKQELKSVY